MEKGFGKVNLVMKSGMALEGQRKDTVFLDLSECSTREQEMVNKSSSYGVI